MDRSAQKFQGLLAFADSVRAEAVMDTPEYLGCTNELEDELSLAAGNNHCNQLLRRLV